ncbi:hypothetical protein VKS41_003476 [Umbelopsis sp. WA50703]
MSYNTKHWAWVKKLFSVNPQSTNGMPATGVFRTPAVGSRPEKYVAPKTEASNVANNYYFQRDTRRNFPRLAVYTQQDVAGLLTGATVDPSLPPAGADSQPVTPATVTETKSLTEVLGSTSLYSKGQMPPTPNWNSTKKWEVSTDWKAPEEGTYFPMRTFV